MKYFFIFLTLFFIFGSTACSSEKISLNQNDVKEAQKKESISTLSKEDTAIINDYKNTINKLNLRDKENADKVMKDSLSEIKKITNNQERQKIEMQIYLATGMYEEAYNLNNKMLKDSFSQELLVTQCELSYYAKRSKDEYEKCYSDLALILKEELRKVSKNDPQYIYGEWGYLLSMYKSGNVEYKNKIKKFIDSIQDETVKYQFESSYGLAEEQKSSYESN